VPVTPAGLPDLTGIAAEAVKGVVNISSVQVIRRPNSPFANDPFFQYFFGGPDDLSGSRDRRELSLGSGVLVSQDGYVVTNSHVVGATERRTLPQITVAFGDRHEVPARIIGTDDATDIALIKIDPVSQPVVPWGDSSALKVADWVLAIGSPYQLDQTVTLGIVSAIGRTNVGITEIEDFIQTDAAINPGNSGGALINTQGQLVGINTSILSQSGGYQGIGFAVPSNLARRIIDELIKYGEVRRGSIGAVILTPVTTQVAQQLGATDTRGALVNRLSEYTYEAGFRAGDIILSFNGQTIEDPGHVQRLVREASIGSSATIVVLREGRQRTLKVPVIQRRS
jgi:serine protease Do